MGRHSIGLLVVVLVLMFTLIGCEEAKAYTYEDFLGEWDLSNGTHISILQDATDPSDKMLDITWYEELIDYFAMVDGSFSGNVFTGTYTYNETTYSDENDDTGVSSYHGAPGKSIAITISMYQDKPKLTCVGEGPLSGKVFSM